MRFPLTVFTLFVFSVADSQLPSAVDLLSKSRQRYAGLEKVSVRVCQRFKSAINTDTLAFLQTLLYEKTSGKRVLKVINDDNGYQGFYDDASFYNISPTTGRIGQNLKTTTTAEVLIDQPVWLAEKYFKRIPFRTIDPRLSTSVSKQPGGYLITVTGGDESNAVYLDSLYRIYRYVENMHSDQYGTQVKVITFTEFDTAYATPVAQEMERVKLAYKTQPKGEEIKQLSEADHKHRRLNMDTLKTLLGISGTSSRYIYLDFFYKSCLPCIQAIPEIAGMRKNFPESDVLIYGIDGNKGDEGDWSAFRNRYGINYPVIDGNAARRILDLIFNHTSIAYPTTLLIEPDGKVRFVQLGYSKNLIKKVERIIGE